ncbi:MAG: hypothetical protein ACT4PP_10850 [Sporichthyaceae bacterium]
MRMNRTGVLAALSAAAIVGLPMITAGPVAAVPYLEQDDPPPATDSPDSADSDTALEIEVIPVPADPDNPPDIEDALDTDIPPSQEDVDEVIIVIADPADPVIDAGEDGGVIDLSEDTVEIGETESTPTPTIPDSPAGEESGDESEESDRQAPSGDFDDAGQDEAGQDQAGQDAEDQAQPDGSVPDSAEVSGNRKTGNERTKPGDAAKPTAPQARTESDSGLPRSGPAQAGVLQTGIALLTGGILLAGAGRHRRTGHSTSI